MRLSAASLAKLADDVARPGYDRKAQAAGIVHFGIGAFHRAHQAWYTDAAMNAGEHHWMITGVSLRSPGVADQINPQDGLYTLVEQSGSGCSMRMIGSVRHVLVATREPDAVVALLAAPTTNIVSFTITEKGYCRTADGVLDPDLAASDSVYAFLIAGLARRRDAGLPGLTLMSCDNLAENGRQLERLVADYCALHNPGLGAWIAAYCAFPCSMVDRIVPATTRDDLAMVAARIGLEDAAAVMTEPFSQWVIEDRFAGPRPAWDKAGAEFVQDVAPYETAKLRMLNGAHSALAYLGLERNHSFVHEAVADPAIRPLIERLMRDEALPTIATSPRQNLSAYADALLARFANPALQHRLIQIAMDGSQKIPQRWLATLAHRQATGADCPAIRAALAAWLRHVRGDNERQWGPVEDPMAEKLRAIWIPGDPARAVHALFGATGIMAGAWQPPPSELAELADAVGTRSVQSDR